MFPKMLKSLLLVPIRLLRKAYRSLRASPALPDLLPVGGLSGERASQLLFALRQVVANEQVAFSCFIAFIAQLLPLQHFNPHLSADVLHAVLLRLLHQSTTFDAKQDEHVVGQWLVSLQLAQIASDRSQPHLQMHSFVNFSM